VTAGTVRTIDPFGFWPFAASGIKGLGGTGAEAPLPGYVFHSNYVRAAAGKACFTCRFDDLRVTRGTVRIEVMRFADATGEFRRRKRITVPLSQVRHGILTVPFVAAADASYAIRATVVDETDATAIGLRIELDRCDDGAAFVARLDRARRTVFARPSRVGTGWLDRISPLEDAGLIAHRRATLDAPLSQMCTAEQFDEPVFGRWVDALGAFRARHRKLWEFVYILQALDRHAVFVSGSRGLGFGVGGERLPALMAGMGCHIVATDLPGDGAAAALWAHNGQHSDSLARLSHPTLCGEAAFAQRVSYRPVDMNAIPADLRGFDFCWSACAYEHLGSIEAGLAFVRNSIQCLRPGGVAVHTTELNLTSDTDTLDRGETVLFRRRDIERLALDLHRAGHKVVPITYDQGAGEVARHVDLPPYSGDVTLKIAIRNYVATSFGLIVQRAA
jgi:hypothetical protein